MATYYVDATNGDNTKDGLSEANAWKTMAKVVGSAFVAGDSILFKRGETWTGTVLTIGWSGAAGSPITFGAYGSGARPIIDGNDIANCIVLTGRSYIELQDLVCANGFDYGILIQTSSHHVSVTDCDCHGAGNDNLIFFNGSYDCTVTGGVFYECYQRVPTYNCSGIEIADGCHDITIDAVTCRDNTGVNAASGVGITIHSHGATVLPYNIVVKDSVFCGNTGYGVQILKQNDVADAPRNIVFEGCTAYNNYQGYRVYKSNAIGNYPNGIVFDRCVASNNTTRTCYLQGDNLTVRRSVFDGIEGHITACDGLKFHNNTLCLPTGAGAYPLYITNARTADNEVKNCIVFCLASGGMAIGVDATVTAAEVDIDYNLYYLAAEAITAERWYWRGTAYGFADWKTNSGQDANSPAPAEPMFVSVPADDFHLKAGSPAIGAGTDLGLFYSGAAPDCGAYERWASRGVTWLHLAGVHEED